MLTAQGSSIKVTDFRSLSLDSLARREYSTPLGKSEQLAYMKKLAPVTEMTRPKKRRILTEAQKARKRLSNRKSAEKKRRQELELEQALSSEADNLRAALQVTRQEKFALEASIVTMRAANRVLLESCLAVLVEKETRLKPNQGLDVNILLKASEILSNPGSTALEAAPSSNQTLIAMACAALSLS